MIGHRRAAGGRQCEGNRFRAVRFCDTAHVASRAIKCLVPRDTLPSRVTCTLRIGAFHGVEKPVLVVDNIRCGLAFSANLFAGRMVRVRAPRRPACRSPPSKYNRIWICTTRKIPECAVYFASWPCLGFSSDVYVRLWLKAVSFGPPHLRPLSTQKQTFQSGMPA